MDVRTCRRCKRLFNYITGPVICPGCREEVEKEFQIVKKYIEENRGLNGPFLSPEASVMAKTAFLCDFYQTHKLC